MKLSRRDDAYDVTMTSNHNLIRFFPVPPVINPSAVYICNGEIMIPKRSTELKVDVILKENLSSFSFIGSQTWVISDAESMIWRRRFRNLTDCSVMKRFVSGEWPQMNISDSRGPRVGNSYN